MYIIMYFHPTNICRFLEKYIRHCYWWLQNIRLINENPFGLEIGMPKRIVTISFGILIHPVQALHPHTVEVSNLHMLRRTSIMDDILVVEAFIMVYGENQLIWLQMLNSRLLRDAYICHYHSTIHSNMMENFIMEIRLEFRCCRSGRYSESYQMRYATILMGKKSFIRVLRNHSIGKEIIFTCYMQLV